jgi:hypothetical protein
MALDETTSEPLQCESWIGPWKLRAEEMNRSVRWRDNCGRAEEHPSCCVASRIGK